MFKWIIPSILLMPFKKDTFADHVNQITSNIEELAKSTQKQLRDIRISDRDPERLKELSGTDEIQGAYMAFEAMYVTLLDINEKIIADASWGEQFSESNLVELDNNLSQATVALEQVIDELEHYDDFPFKDATVGDTLEILQSRIKDNLLTQLKVLQNEVGQALEDDLTHEEPQVGAALPSVNNEQNDTETDESKPKRDVKKLIILGVGATVTFSALAAIILSSSTPEIEKNLDEDFAAEGGAKMDPEPTVSTDATNEGITRSDIEALKAANAKMDNMSEDQKPITYALNDQGTANLTDDTVSIHTDHAQFNNGLVGSTIIVKRDQCDKGVCETFNASVVRNNGTLAQWMSSKHSITFDEPVNRKIIVTFSQQTP